MTKKLFRNIDKKMEKIEQTIIESTEQVLVEMSERSLQEAPLMDGDLRDSYVVTGNNKDIIKGSNSGNPKIVGTAYNKNIKDIVYEASYNTPYARRQHEEMDYYHPTPGTKCKYLQDPFLAYYEYFVDDVQDAVNKVVRK